jgi:Domain of Unknown Function (DUF928)
MNLFKLTATICWAILLSSGAIASTFSPSVPTKPFSQTRNPPPAPDNGTPQGPQVDGGDRPGDTKCPAVSIPAIAFMPRDGQTTQAYPTFWFYIPYTAAQVKSVRFVIVDEQDNEFLPEREIQISETVGLIHLSLPSTFNSLEIGKYYNWYFTIDCQSDHLEDRVALRGTLERLAVNSLDEGLTELERAIEQERWSDALSLIETSQQRDRLFEDISKASDLDEKYSFQWSHIADSLILPCCTLIEP